MIAKHSDLEVCGQAETTNDALALIGSTHPHVAIVDISLKNSNGIELIERIKARFEAVRIIVASMHDELVYAERALQAGAPWEKPRMGGLAARAEGCPHSKYRVCCFATYTGVPPPHPSPMHSHAVSTL